MNTETEINSALYYPYIEFADPRWLWTAALVWDKVYRIVPDDYTPQDSDNVKALCADGDIGIPIRPRAYAKDVAMEFMLKLHKKEWQAAALEKEVHSELLWVVTVERGGSAPVASRIFRQK